MIIMKKVNQIKAGKVLGFFAVFALALMTTPRLQADVLVLQSGSVITGKVLQQNTNGVLLQMEYGTFRYPLNLIKEVQQEAAAAPHVSNNGQTIPDWAQIVSLLAQNAWADNLQQVPAPVINYGMFNNIPYISFRCAGGGYEVNIYGDLNAPVAIQAGAMTYNSENAAAKSNCVNFVCSVLASAEARKAVRALDLSQKVMTTSAGMGFETLLPGEWGSYGGWSLVVFNPATLASAQASAAEMAALAQPRVATLPPALVSAPPPASAGTMAGSTDATTSTPASAQPTTSTYETYYGYGTTYAAAAGWTAAEIQEAHPAVQPATYPGNTDKAAYPASTPDTVYPRTYTRSGGTYSGYRR
jgi:hypothetical protein